MYEAAGVLLFDEPTRAVRAASALVHFAEQARRAARQDPPPPLPTGAVPPPARAVNEVDAKAILASAGIPWWPNASRRTVTQPHARPQRWAIPWY